MRLCLLSALATFRINFSINRTATDNLLTPHTFVRFCPWALWPPTRLSARHNLVSGSSWVASSALSSHCRRCCVCTSAQTCRWASRCSAPSSSQVQGWVHLSSWCSRRGILDHKFSWTKRAFERVPHFLYNLKIRELHRAPTVGIDVRDFPAIYQLTFPTALHSHRPSNCKCLQSIHAAQRWFELEIDCAGWSFPASAD